VTAASENGPLPPPRAFSKTFKTSIAMDASFGTDVPTLSAWLPAHESGFIVRIAHRKNPL
jgi:hypothetical protein